MGPPLKGTSLEPPVLPLRLAEPVSQPRDAAVEGVRAPIGADRKHPRRARRRQRREQIGDPFRAQGQAGPGRRWRPAWRGVRRQGRGGVFRFFDRPNLTARARFVSSVAVFAFWGKVFYGGRSLNGLGTG